MVFTYGLDICNKDINDAGISDHFPISFDIGLSAAGPQSGALSRPLRVLSSEAVSKFAVSFLDLAFMIPDCCSVCSSDGYADIFLSLLSSTPDLAVPDDCSFCSVDGCANILLSFCSSILDSVAPIKMKRPRTYSHCWKKDKLQVSYDMLRTSHSQFQTAARMAKASFLSKVILANGHNPRMLLKIFNSVVNPCPDMPLLYSQALCERFQILFFR